MKVRTVLTFCSAPNGKKTQIGEAGSGRILERWSGDPGMESLPGIKATRPLANVAKGQLEIGSG